MVDGGVDRDRTDDLVIANDALSQLSYGPSKQVSASLGLRPTGKLKYTFPYLAMNNLPS